MSKNSIPYLSNLFFLDISFYRNKVKIRMEVTIPIFTTAHLPHTRTYLASHLPNVLLTQCFNENHLPFSQEVMHTEIGHLFEHILLEYLCMEKIASGSATAVFNGRTTWNWKKDKKGIFHIVVDVKKADHSLLYAALKKTIILTETLLQTPSYTPLTKLAYVHELKTDSLSIKNLRVPS